MIVATPRLAIATRGQGSGAPLLLLHSLGLGAAAWEPQMADLAFGHRAIACDLRGHGGSSWDGRPFSIDDLAEDVAGLLDALSLERVDLVGLGLGGCVAMALAARRPHRARRLVLAGCAAVYGEAEREAWEQRARGYLELGPADLAAASAQRWFSPAFRARQPAELERLLALLLGSERRALAEACRALARFDGRQGLAQISAPTLVVVAEEDVATPPGAGAEIAGAVPGARLRHVRQAGHLSLLEQPGLLAEALGAGERPTGGRGLTHDGGDAWQSQRNH